MSKRVFEIEISQEAIALMKISCDNCGKELGESYLKGRDTIGLTLPDGQTDDGYDKYKAFHFCDEACLREVLNKRATPAS